MDERKQAWEVLEVNGPGPTVMRFPVPGGWLYKVGEQVQFVDDPDWYEKREPVPVLTGDGQMQPGPAGWTWPGGSIQAVDEFTVVSPEIWDALDPKPSRPDVPLPVVVWEEDETGESTGVLRSAEEARIVLQHEFDPAKAQRSGDWSQMTQQDWEGSADGIRASIVPVDSAERPQPGPVTLVGDGPVEPGFHGGCCDAAGPHLTDRQLMLLEAARVRMVEAPPSLSDLVDPLRQETGFGPKED